MKAAVVRLAASILLLSSSYALDLEIRSFLCDESLPVSVVDGAVDMTCSSDPKCTFGDSVLVQGQLNYNGVEKLGMEDNTTAYMSGKFDISVDYLVIPNTKMNLCADEYDEDSSWITAVENTTQCPQDGIYDFEAVFMLPYYESNWWATGWHDVGQVNLYAGASQELLIGSCEIHYVTKVTSDSQFHAPSALTTLFIIGGVTLVSVTWALYCIFFVYRARRRQRTNKTKHDNNGHDDDDDDERYRYMNDDHDTLTEGSGTLHTNLDSTVTGHRGLHEEDISESRWRFLERGLGFANNYEEADVFCASIPKAVSYDSGIVATRSGDTVELPHMTSMGSVDDSTLSGASSSILTESTTSHSASESSASVSSSGLIYEEAPIYTRQKGGINWLVGDGSVDTCSKHSRHDINEDALKYQQMEI